MLNRGDIEGILDANYFVAINNGTYKKLLSSKVPLFKLKEISNLVTKGESPLWQGDDFQETGIPFIRGKNIKHGSVVFDDVVFIDKEAHQKLKRSILNEDLLLLTMAGTLGDVAIFRKEFPESNINQDIAKIRLLTEKVSYDYANVFFQTELAKVQIAILSNGGTRGHLNFDKIRAFKVPVPSTERQKEIVLFFEDAKAEKKAKEAEAREKLASVDSLVLDALGISLPEAEENTLAGRIFFTKSSDISNGRYDPEFIQYQHQFESKYPTYTLKQLLTKRPQYGANEMGVERISNDEPRYIRITDIDESGKLIDKDLGKTAETIEEKYILQNNDLLFARSGNTVGKCYLHKDNLPYQSFFAGYMIRFVLNEDLVLPDYVFSFTQTKIYKDWIKAIKRTAGQPNINAEEYQTLKIPIPPPEVQREIAERVEAIYAEAKLLREQGAEILKNAKAEVEKMILDA